MTQPQDAFDQSSYPSRPRKLSRWRRVLLGSVIVLCMVVVNFDIAFASYTFVYNMVLQFKAGALTAVSMEIALRTSIIIASLVLLCRDGKHLAVNVRKYAQKTVRAIRRVFASVKKEK